jgi:adenosylcobinamide-GDP ribazoletransferase
MGLVFIGNGGLHLDGLLDCLDGWFCMGDKEKRLQAMKDPRAGALGAIGIGHFLLLKAALFWACMERGMLVEAVWAALVLARMPLAFELGFLPQATPGRGLAAYIRPGWLDGLVALLLTSGLLAPILLVAPERWLPLTVGAGLGLAITLLWHIAWQQRIQGINGDVLGAAIELREAALLAGFAIYLPG